MKTTVRLFWAASRCVGASTARLAVAALVALAALNGAANAYAASVRYVALSGKDIGKCLSSTTPCRTVAYAIGVAASGDTIKIAAGTFYEADIDVDKDLVLSGAGAAKTILDAAYAGPVVIISGVTATIEGVTIQHGWVCGGCLVVGGVTNLHGTLMLKNSIVQGNTGQTFGAGILNLGIMTVLRTTVRDNSSPGPGSGIDTFGPLTMDADIVSHNTSQESGGGIYVNAAGGLQVRIQESSVVGNVAGGDGGGIFNATGVVALDHSVVSANRSGGNGGGIDDSGAVGDALTLSNVTVSFNLANRSNVGALGGGVYNTVGGMKLTDVTIDGNSAAGGGGIYNDASSAALTNVTFSGNSAIVGGGIDNAGAMTLTNVTFGGNWSLSGGAIYASETVTLKNTIVANSTSGGNCFGTLADGGHNLDSGTTCGFSAVKHDLVNVNPKLGALASNGGFTQTMALLSGSPAINKGTDTGCPSKDQRGHARITPTDPICDIGAYEYP